LLYSAAVPEPIFPALDPQLRAHGLLQVVTLGSMFCYRAGAGTARAAPADPQLVQHWL